MTARKRAIYIVATQLATLFKETGKLWINDLVSSVQHHLGHRLDRSKEDCSVLLRSAVVCLSHTSGSNGLKQRTGQGSPSS